MCHRAASTPRCDDSAARVEDRISDLLAPGLRHRAVGASKQRCCQIAVEGARRDGRSWVVEAAMM
jgi:hypothetical protein